MSNWIALPKNKPLEIALADVEEVLADFSAHDDLTVSYDVDLVPETRNGLRGISIRINGESDITPADIIVCLENIW